jgi:hypothetical protein
VADGIIVWNPLEDMMLENGRALCVGVTVVVMLSGGIAGAQKGALSGVVIESMDTGREGGGLRVRVGEGGDPPISEVRFEIGKRSAADLETGLIPPGWRSRTDGGTVVTSGPEAAPPVYIRLDPGPEVAFPTTMGVQVFSGGDRVFKEKVNVSPHRAPPVDADGLSEVISLPPSLSPGETITTTVVDSPRAPFGGQWTLAGSDGREGRAPASESAVYTVSFRVPVDLRSGAPVEVRYVDPWGASTIDVDAAENVNVTPPIDDAGPPRIDSSQRYTFIGLTGCVCGHFPTAESQRALEIGGMPIGEPLATSSSVVVFRLPEGISPGEHTVTARPDAGFDSQMDVEIVALQLSGTIDQERLRRGQSTPMQISIEGSEEPLELRLINKTPEIVSLEGGEEGFVLTSGGSENTVDRIVHGHTPGDFRIIYEMANDPCPCGPEGQAVDSAPEGTPLVQTGYPVPEGATVGTPVSTGRTTGVVAEVEVRNEGTETIFFPDRAVLIPSSGEHQGYVVPRGRRRGTPIPPGGTETVPLDGYCTDVDKPPVPSGEPLPDPSEWSVPSDPGRPFPEPGSSDFSEENPEVQVIGGVESILRVTEELQQTGELETPFSSDPERERETVNQQTIWIYTAEREGRPYTRDDFAERLEDQYEERTGTPISEAPEKDRERLDEGIDDFWDAFELVGERAKVLDRGEEPSLPIETVPEEAEEPPCDIGRHLAHSQAASDFKMSESYKDEAKRANLREWFGELPQISDATEGGTFETNKYPASAWAVAGRDFIGGYCNAVAKHIYAEAGGGTDWVWSTELLEVEAKSNGTHTVTVQPPSGTECETLVVGSGGGVVESWSNTIDPIAEHRNLLTALRIVAAVAVGVATAPLSVPASMAAAVITVAATEAFNAGFSDDANAAVAVEGQMVVQAGRRRITIAANSRSTLSGGGDIESDAAKVEVGETSDTHATTLTVTTAGLAALKTRASSNGIAEGTVESQVGVAIVGLCRCGGGVQVGFLTDSGLFLVEKGAANAATRTAQRLEELVGQAVDRYLELPPEEVIPKARQDLPTDLEGLLREWYLENGSGEGGAGYFDISAGSVGGN